jgi:hypothetical protein
MALAFIRTVASRAAARSAAVRPVGFFGFWLRVLSSDKNYISAVADLTSGIRERRPARNLLWKNTLYFAISVYPLLLQSSECFHHAAPQHDVSSPRGVSCRCEPADTDIVKGISLPLTLDFGASASGSRKVTGHFQHQIRGIRGSYARAKSGQRTHVDVRFKGVFPERSRAGI